MNDRKLLELAAKAAGVPWEGVIEDGGVFVLDGRQWGPLTDDGDALRLAVALHIDISSYKESGNVHAHSKHSLGMGTSGYHSYQAHEVMTEAFGEDRMAATRRAIVRAAAEIGKTRSD